MADGKRIFTVDYYPAAQTKFEAALRNREYSAAAGILDNLLPSRTQTEHEDRAIVLVQGYRALARAMIGIPTSSAGVSALKGSSAENDAALTKYKELGTPDEIKEKLDTAQKTIESYDELGTPKEIGKKLDNLKQYEVLGSIAQLTNIVEAHSSRRGAISLLETLI